MKAVQRAARLSGPSHPSRPSGLFGLPLLAVLAAATGCLSAQAQVANGAPSGSNDRMAATSSASAYNRDAHSLLPFTRRGYVGLNLGRTHFGSACGAGGYGCDNASGAGFLYTGGLLNEWVGLELGYLNTGKADRSGGATRAQGIDLLAVIRAPVASFNVFAKGGAVYGQTRVSTGARSDITSGRRRSWGPAYGGGVGLDFMPNSGVVLEWMRHELPFPGNDGRQDLDITSLGYVYRF